MDSIHVQALRRSMSIKGFPKRLKTGNTPSLPPFFWDLSRGFGGTFGPQKLSFKAFFFPPGRKEAGLKSSSCSSQHKKLMDVSNMAAQKTTIKPSTWSPTPCSSPHSDSGRLKEPDGGWLPKSSGAAKLERGKALLWDQIFISNTSII